jgi:hypothetical protein
MTMGARNLLKGRFSINESTVLNTHSSLLCLLLLGDILAAFSDFDASYMSECFPVSCSSLPLYFLRFFFAFIPWLCLPFNSPSFTPTRFPS